MLDFFKPKQDPETEIAEALFLIEESRTGVENLVPLYMTWSVEAANLGDDEYSDQLLEEMAELDDFAADLRALELKIKSSAIAAKAFKNLIGLAEAVKRCKGLFNAGTDFTKIGKNLAVFKDNLGKGSAALRGLRRELSKKNVPIDIRLSGVKPADSAKLAALKEKREILLATPPSISEPKETTATGIIDIDAIIEEENNN